MKTALILILFLITTNLFAEVKVGDIELRKIPNADFNRISTLTKDDLIIIVAYGTECPILRKHTSTLKKMIPELSKNNIPVYFVNLIKHTSDQELLENLKSYDVGGDVYSPKNSAQLKELGMTVLSEAALIRLSTNEVLYKGAINNQITLDLTRPVATEHYLQEAVTSVLSKNPVKVKSTKTFGCEITY